MSRVRTSSPAPLKIPHEVITMRKIIEAKNIEKKQLTREERVLEAHKMFLIKNKEAYNKLSKL